MANDRPSIDDRCPIVNCRTNLLSEHSALSFGLLALVLVLAGCAEPDASRVRPPAPSTNPGYLMLSLSPPTVLNWDTVPGADGVRAEIDFFAPSSELAVPVDGKLDVFLYSDEVSADQSPLHTWTFTSAELGGHLTRTMVGWGYVFSLGWAPDQPKGDRVTFKARFTSPEGGVLTGDPVTVPMTAK
jgi:hypothetical protein